MEIMKQTTLEAVTVGKNNEIVLPPEYLEALGVGPGDLVQLRIENGTLYIAPKKLISSWEAAEKYARPRGSDTVARLRTERGWDEYDAQSRQ
jgi:antitoxin component of MazEF toxin-antitoxin module